MPWHRLQSPCDIAGHPTIRYKLDSDPNTRFDRIIKTIVRRKNRIERHTPALLECIAREECPTKHFDNIWWRRGSIYAMFAVCWCVHVTILPSAIDVRLSLSPLTSHIHRSIVSVERIRASFIAGENGSVFCVCVCVVHRWYRNNNILWGSFYASLTKNALT